MPEINPFFTQLVRQDALTNTGNQVSFFDWLIAVHKQEPFKPFSLMSTELVGLKKLNETKGRQAGDTALRWAANTIQDVIAQPTFRIGNEYITVLSEGDAQAQATMAKRLYDTLNKQVGAVGLESPAAAVVVISFYHPSQATPENILSAYYAALFFLKQKPEISFKVFDSRQMSAPTGFLSHVVQHTVSRFTSIGSMLDQSNQLAFLDPISGLPNARAALLELEESVRTAQQARDNFSILIVDGDTLGNYNQISYTGGDDMIRRLGELLRKETRPTDYVARWHKGDQFLVILRGSLPQSAVAVGERMRVAVETRSKEWMIYSTISVGVAGCPQHAKTAEKLVEAAENALQRAKQQGKNQVASAG